MGRKGSGIVVPLAANICVTVRDAQWLSVIIHRWQRKALLRAKFYLRMLNNQGSATVSLILKQEGSVKQLCSFPL
jgi:hypothetical protein